MDPIDWLAAPGRQEELESTLRALVEISSHTADVEGTRRVAERLQAECERRAPSLRCALVDGPTGRFGPHLVGATPAEGAPLLLVGHHDTVFPAARFAGFVEEGPLLRGPGVLDMKGGLVVILFALAALEQAGQLAQRPLRFLSVSDEEVGSPDSRALLAEAARGARAGLVFESGRAGDLIITRRKGTGSLVVEMQGRAAHAGNLHHEGVNAVWALARFVDGAQQLTDYDAGRTVNVGRVEGGLGKNTVPDRARAEVDFRFVRPDDGEVLRTALERAAQQAAATLPGAVATVSGGVSRPPLERSPASEALLHLYGACARASGLGSDEAPLLGGGSDANNLSAGGLPCIDGLGPRGRGFHTLDEQVERATLLPKAAALARLLLAPPEG